MVLARRSRGRQWSLAIAALAALATVAVAAVAVLGTATVARAAAGGTGGDRGQSQLLRGGAVTSEPLPFIRSPSTGSELFALSCPGASGCWAAGFYVNAVTAKLGQVYRLQGTKWSRVPIPQPGGVGPSSYDYLNGLACTSASDCWAVGYYGQAGKGSVNEALRWQGGRWRSVPTPQPAGTSRASDQNQLEGITCSSSRDCWAVGTYTNKAGSYLTETLRWNGRKWTTLPTPDPLGTAKGEANVLMGVSCVSRATCLAVGYGHARSGAYLNLALRLKGTRWTRLSTPQPGGSGSDAYAYLQGLACPSSSDCWAAGGYLRHGAYLNEALQWDGKHWQQGALPNPGGSAGGADNELTALACTSRSDCWGVGYYYNASNVALNEALHYDGATWTSYPTPQPGGTANNTEGNTLTAVSCNSPNRCSAVGYLFQNEDRTLNEALAWDGTAWSTS